MMMSVQVDVSKRGIQKRKKKKKQIRNERWMKSVYKKKEFKKSQEEIMPEGLKEGQDLIDVRH
jgi:hypothetical protein